MTMVNEGWYPPKEHSPHASTEQRVSASAPSGELPVTEQEDEAFERMGALE